MKDPATGLPITSEPHSSGADLNDEGIAGLMVKFNEVTKKCGYFIIERNGKFFKLDENLNVVP